MMPTPKAPAASKGGGKSADDVTFIAAEGNKCSPCGAGDPF